MKAWASAPFVIILVLVYGLEEEGVSAIFFFLIFVWYNERDYTAATYFRKTLHLTCLAISKYSSAW